MENILYFLTKSIPPTLTLIIGDQTSRGHDLLQSLEQFGAAGIQGGGELQCLCDRVQHTEQRYVVDFASGIKFIFQLKKN